MTKYRCPLPHDPPKVFNTWKGWRTHVATHRPKRRGGYTHAEADAMDPDPILLEENHE